MSYWILSEVLSDELRDLAVRGNELALPANGLASLNRAHGPDQIAEWLRELQPDATPEHITFEAECYWRLGHELLNEDTIILRVRGGVAYLIGEIAGSYRREERLGEMMHIWPVTWLEVNVPTDRLPKLAQYANDAGLIEVRDEHALHNLRPFIPSLQKGNAGFFKWLGIIILFFELVYFWPK